MVFLLVLSVTFSPIISMDNVVYADYIEGGPSDEEGDILWGTDDSDFIFGDYNPFGGYGRWGLTPGWIKNLELSNEESFDIIFGEGGNDFIHAGPGDDLVDGGDGDDEIYGGFGNDVILGGNDNDSVIGGPGDDVIIGSPGNDTINGGEGNDAVDGDAGDDTINGNQDNDVILGGDGNDTIDGGSDDDYLDGGAGDDYIQGGEGDDDIYGGEGDDRIESGPGNDIIEGGEGDDYDIDGGSGDDYIYGGEGNDDLDGDDGDDYIYGEEGNDDLDGDEGDDEICGGAGDDYIDGDEGNDDIYGDEGNDQVHGGSGEDYINGEEGNDNISGGDGNDEIHGQDGDDVIYGDDGEETEEELNEENISEECEESSEDTNNDIIYGGDGNDEIYGEEGNDYLDGGAGNDEIDGGNGEDIIIGGEGNDTIEGGECEDTISGEEGNDTIDGGEGDDTINGGSGNDVIDGNEGNDTAEYNEDSSEHSIIIGENDEGEVELTISDGEAQDSLTNVENVDFSNEKFKDITYTPIDGYLCNLVRNEDGTYTAYWGYENNNQFKAIEKQNYFEDKSGVQDNSNMIFETGKNDSSITTKLKNFIQKWVLGDKEVVADARGLEEAFQRALEGKGNGNSNELRTEIERFLALLRKLKQQNILRDKEYTLEYFEESITVGELAEVLDRVTTCSTEEILNLGYDKDEYVTKEKLSVILFTAFRLVPEKNPELPFEDVDEISDMAKGYVARDCEYRIRTCLILKQFNPKEEVERLEAFKAISFYLDFLR